MQLSEQVKHVELEILEAVIRLCDAHGIAYFIESGTALGAMRHGGFIPWDDDIDLGMLRPDYEKFLSLAPAELPKHFFVQNAFTDKNAPFLFSKVRKNDTLFVEWNKRDIDMHHGIFIDIFPYDYLPNDAKVRERFVKSIRRRYTMYLLKKLPGTVSSPQKSLRWLLKSAAKKSLNLALALVSEERLVEGLKKDFVKYRHHPSPQVACLVARNIHYFDVDMLYPPREVSFEHLRCKAPGELETYLTMMYGDFRKLPPEEERVGHNAYRIEV